MKTKYMYIWVLNMSNTIFIQKKFKKNKFSFSEIINGGYITYWYNGPLCLTNYPHRFQLDTWLSQLQEVTSSKWSF